MALKNLIKILLKPKYLVLQIAAFVFMVGGTIMNVALPLIASKFLDEYFQQGFISNSGIVTAIILLISLLIIPIINAWLNAYIGNNIGFELKNLLINKILNFPIHEYTKHDQAKLFTIITNDVNTVKDALTRVIGTILFALILLVGSIFFMYQINSKVAIVIFIVIPLITSAVAIVFRSVVKLFKKTQEARDSLNKMIDENIKASMLVRVFVAEQTEKDKFALANDRQYKIALEIVKKISLVFPILNITLYVGQLIVLLVGGYEAIDGRLTVGELSAFTNYVVMFTTPLLILSFMLTLIGQAMTSLGRINTILNVKATAKQPETIINDFQKIELKKINLNLADKQILRDVNFTISKGQKIGIVGMTGSGKSIFCESLMNFFADFEGEFLVNDLPINTINFDQFRKLIGYVPQKNFILADTIYNNIDFYRNLEKDTIEKAARVAEVNEFCEKFPSEFQENAGEEGNKLSGGQKQRITLARALAGNPQIILLDDSTSKLDMETENKIMNNIRKEYPDTTIIIVAQKIASIKDCDQIYIMEDGTFTINGTHEFLLDNSYLYQEIDLTQSNYSHE
jgi:ATP-binding cassette subfamily B protein